MPAPAYIFALLLAICFTLGTLLQPRALKWNESRAQSGSLLAVTMGDARRMFGNHFFVKADEYFHSGYYPSIFDQARTNEMHIAEQAGKDPQAKAEEEKETSFFGPPHDWIEKSGRNFINTDHTHLDDLGQEREILPWLRLSAEMDPQRVETYTVASYWLRSRMNRPAEAEQFLREGLRANPSSHEILFELGRLFNENHHDTARARNLWEVALSKWQAQERQKEKPNLFALDEITVSLGRLEEKEGNLERAISWFERAKEASPRPEELQRQIDELKRKLTPQPQSSTPRSY